VEVTMVDQDAPAGKAGVKEHDVILSVNGTAVDSAAQLRRVIHETPAGRVVTLQLSRDGQTMTVKTQLAERSKAAMLWSPKAKEFKDYQVNVMPAMPPMPDFDLPGAMVVVRSSMRSGLTVENLTPQLGEFFGVKDGKGVLVRGVDKGSRAEQAGLRAGDVIVKINDQPVHDTTDFSYALRRSHDSKAISVGVIRDKHEQNLSLPQPDAKESGEIFNEDDETELDLNANADQLVEVKDLMADLKPELELAQHEAQMAARELTTSACEQQKALSAQSKAIAKAQAETKSQLRHLQKKLIALKKAQLDI